MVKANQAFLTLSLNMKYVHYLSILLLLIYTSCNEDGERIIQTDLPTEAGQLFKVSQAVGESLYFALLPLDSYISMDSLNLPGCPVIEIDETEKKVRLTFDPAAACEQAGDNTRSGSLLISYFEPEIRPAFRYLEYEDYVFEGDTLTGSRLFTFLTSTQVKEEFPAMGMLSPRGLSHHQRGEYRHELQFDGNALTSITTSGKLTGTNPVGRDFSIEITVPTLLLLPCIQSDLLVPVSGRERWEVRRGTVAISHTLEYELRENCEVDAYATLQDGRRLLVNP